MRLFNKYLTNGHYFLTCVISKYYIISQGQHLEGKCDIVLG
jgi:hypothetical protein